jgi:hypothetical protein
MCCARHMRTMTDAWVRTRVHVAAVASLIGRRQSIRKMPSDQFEAVSKIGAVLVALNVGHTFGIGGMVGEKILQHLINPHEC